MFEKSNTYKIASVIVAVVLGAGFATGQELISFFVRFGHKGFVGILISGALFALLSWAVLDICHRKSIKSYNEFMLYVFGKRLSVFMENAITLFLFVIFSTMISAGGEVVREIFGLPFFVGGVIVAAFCILTFAFGLDGFVKANAALAPIMVVGAVIIGLYTYINESVPVFFQEVLLIRKSWAFSAILYTSYNMLTAISVLCSLAALVVSKRTSFVSGLTAGVVIAVLGISMSLPLFVNYKEVLGAEIPMLQITRRMGSLIEYIYLIILFAAIYTTAVANGFALTQWIKSNFNVDSMLIKILVTGVAVICSHAGFSNFVSIFYPLFGYIGILEMSFILVRFIGLRISDAVGRSL